MAQMMFWLLSIVAWRVSAVRLQEDVIDESQGDSSAQEVADLKDKSGQAFSEFLDPYGKEAHAACVEHLRPLVHTSSYRDLFNPMFAASAASSTKKGDADKHLEGQWGAVSTLPLWPGSQTLLTWGKMCMGKKSDACYKLFKYERERLLSQGKLSETESHVVTENAVQGLCDMNVDALRGLAENMFVVKDLFLSPIGSQCVQNRLVSFAGAFREALEEECFGSCLRHLQTAMETMTCDTKGTDWQQFFNDTLAGNEQCVSLPSDSLEELADHVMKQKCLRWYPPTFLWVPAAKEPHDMAQEDYDGVCSVLFSDALNSHDDHDIIQKGQCPSGTSCACPFEFGVDKQTTSEIRDHGYQLFVTKGKASVPGIWRKLYTSYITKAAGKTAKTLLKYGLSKLYLTNFVPTVTPIWLVTQAWKIGWKIHQAKQKFLCAETVGCWPTTPKAEWTRNSARACRIPDTAKEGGSPVWFLPPPLVKVKRNKLGLCILTSCSEEDVAAERVGFGDEESWEGKKVHWASKEAAKPEVYNCQPLEYEDMSGTQRTEFMTALARSGVATEYDI